jgi:hypothetical protein
MIYTLLLTLHSLVRWLVLAGLLSVLFRAYRGWWQRKPFSRLDNAFRHWTVTAAYIQLVLGLWLYLVSPVMDYFLHHYKEAVLQREVRFFGMEHSPMMIFAVVLVTLGSARARRRKEDLEKHKTLALWFSLGLLIILVSVPWPFSPMAARPWFRPF